MKALVIMTVLGFAALGATAFIVADDAQQPPANAAICVLKVSGMT